MTGYLVWRPTWFAVGFLDRCERWTGHANGGKSRDLHHTHCLYRDIRPSEARLGR